ncbi:MAG: cytochrome P450 [Panacagrimonas sp.]
MQQLAEAVTPAFNIVGPEAIRDPQTFFGRLRQTEPIYWDETYRSWLITNHRHISALVREPRLSSDRINPFIQRKLSGPDVDPLMRQAFNILAGWMVFQDEPGHARLRVLVSKGFTTRSVSLLRDRCAALCAELLDRVPMDREFDLMEAVIAPLPSIIIAERLGVPVEDRLRFEGWTRMVAPLVSGGLDDPRRYEGVAEGMDELVRYFRGLMQRYTAAPEDNLITDLLRARENDDSLSEAEVIATLTLVLFGGHETTANFIANALVALQRHPSQWAALRDGLVDPAVAVEELLRFDGPAKALTRVVRKAFTYEGFHFEAGDRIFLILACANRDPEVFDDPDTLRLDREGSRRHIGFGYGAHFCMGAQLARLEASIALPRILRHLPRMRLADRPLEWIPVLLTRGQHALHVHAS